MSLVSDYINKVDWRVKENSNKVYSYASMVGYLAGSVIAKHTLENVYTKEISDAHRDGHIHIHDLNNGICGYCAGFSLFTLIKDGFRSINGKVASAPAKHLSAIFLQMVNFINTLQTEWAGAMAFSSVDTYLAPFIAADKLSYDEVKQLMQQFIFGLNTASRLGETAFSNISLDLTPPADLADVPVVIGGVPRPDLGCYKDFQKEMDMFNIALLEVMGEGDCRGSIFTFPILTYNITKDFDWTSTISDKLMTATAKYGLPYFSNYVSSGLEPGAVRSMCCRLSLDLDQLNEHAGGLFGSPDSTGSLGVVTLSLPQIACDAEKDVNKFFVILEKYLKIAADSLTIKRAVLNDNFDRGMFPYTAYYLPRKFDYHFSTIGIVGGHEMCVNLLGQGIQTAEGREFTLKVMDYIRDFVLRAQKEHGVLFNFEATPAESCSMRMARLMREKYPESIVAGTTTPYFTNSTHLPVNYTTDLWKALEHQTDIQLKYNSGTVFHVYLSEAPDPVVCKTLIQKITQNYKIFYFSITPSFSVCQDHGYIKGVHYTCPMCD